MNASPVTVTHVGRPPLTIYPLRPTESAKRQARCPCPERLGRFVVSKKPNPHPNLQPRLKRTPARITTATELRIQAPPQSKPPRPSLVLAARVCQRRWERRQRRAGRAGWFALFNPAPFASIRARAVLGVSFAGSTPLVYVLAPPWCDRRRSGAASCPP